MTPFQALYGREPPTIPNYMISSSQVPSIESTLQEHQRVVSILKKTLQKTRQRMTDQANKHRMDKEFEVGELVYVRLKIYRQTSVSRRESHKLSRRYFGPFKILQKIGKVAYRLELPEGSRIHPVFHVSLLRPCFGNSTPSSLPLPTECIDNLPLLSPEKVLERRSVDGKEQVLVKWKDRDILEATWESAEEIGTLNTTPDLEDKVNVDGEGVDTGQPTGALRRSTRHRVVPARLSD